MLIQTNAALLCAVVAVSCMGCRTFSDPARHHTLDPAKAYRLDFDASRRGAVILPMPSGATRPNAFILAEPAPDVALGTVTDLTGKLNYQGIDASASAKITENIIELGKRTQAIMFLRELMYRAAEQHLNGAITSTELTALNQQIIAAAKDIALAEKASAVAALYRSIKSLDPNAQLDAQTLLQALSPSR